ncbi:MAG: SDR family oxidoreductase [Lachnospiraceae bacterium]|nr:SDR family oxidoreductase [Lachnospiraceae bacterium]
MQTLKGRTCIFAGGSGGDGVDTVKALCAAGMNVILMTHMPEQAQALVDEIAAGDYMGICIATTEGMAGSADGNDVYAKIAETYGSIDVVITNTGADGVKDDMETLDFAQIAKDIENLAGGSFKMMQRALPYLKKSRAPRVIFMTTVEGCNGGTHESFSNAVAKGAVRSLILNSAARLAKYGITVNGISKGAIPRTVGHMDEGAPKPEEILDKIPLGRIGSPEDLAGAICFFASEESSFITGEILELSGGLQLG